MKKILRKKLKQVTESVFLYVTGGTNETCSNGSCGGESTAPTPGGGCTAMGGNTVCHP